jgi:hypothetical protein
MAHQRELTFEETKTCIMCGNQKGTNSFPENSDICQHCTEKDHITGRQHDMIKGIITSYGYTCYATACGGIKGSVEEILRQMREVGH